MPCDVLCCSLFISLLFEIFFLFTYYILALFQFSYFPLSQQVTKNILYLLSCLLSPFSYGHPSALQLCIHTYIHIYTSTCLCRMLVGVGLVDRCHQRAASVLAPLWHRSDLNVPRRPPAQDNPRHH